MKLPFHSTKERVIDTATKPEGRAVPWNKGKLLGQKPPLKLKGDLGHPDVVQGSRVAPRAIVMQKKTQRPV